jgi:flagellar hook-associated protein 3 FlgL
MQNSMEDIFNMQEQMGTGQKINRPSDDPAAMVSITGNKTQLANIAQYKKNIDSTKISLSATNTVLTGLQQILSSGSDMAIKAGDMSSQDRNTFAGTVNGIMQSAMSIANTKVGDTYIFSGHNSDKPAIDTTTGEFLGTPDKVLTDIAPGIKMAINVTANELFSFKKTSAADPATAVLPSYNQVFSANPVGAFPTPGQPGTPYDADPVSALNTTAGAADPNAANSGSTNGGTLTITEGTNAPVNVAIGAGDTLNQLRDKINASGAAVKAAVVNFDKTGGAPDYRLVLASSPAGSSDKISLDVVTADAAGAGLNRLAYNATTKNMTLGKDITNYNYITDPTNPNYYSFNNNYLNENNVLRSINFLKESMAHNDGGRIGKAVNYISNLTVKLRQVQIDVAARTTQMTDQATFNASRDTDITGYVSNKLMLQDTDYAKLALQTTQKQATLESLRNLSSAFLKSSLFDFI